MFYWEVGVGLVGSGKGRRIPPAFEQRNHGRYITAYLALGILLGSFVAFLFLGHRMIIEYPSVLGVTVLTKDGPTIYPGTTVCHVDDGHGMLVIDLSRVRRGEVVWLIGANVWGLVE